jgi:hypothetical protein
MTPYQLDVLQKKAILEADDDGDDVMLLGAAAAAAKTDASSGASSYMPWVNAAAGIAQGAMQTFGPKLAPTTPPKPPTPKPQKSWFAANPAATVGIAIGGVGLLALIIRMATRKGGRRR